MDCKFIRLIPMPSFCGGFTLEDENGDYNIYVNEGLCHLKIEETIKHEMRHIENNDFHKYVDVVIAETKAKQPTEINFRDVLFT